MIFKNAVTIYLVQGLNFKKFLDSLKKQNIDILELEKIEYNLFRIGIEEKNRDRFLAITKKFNYLVNEDKLPRAKVIDRKIKGNIALTIVFVLIFISIFISSNFVYQTKIYGLENVSKQEVLRVLDENGFREGRFKSSYDLDRIEQVLTSKIEGISYASAVIKGNTLIVNINEKIDNSDYIYDYSPIFAPFDCIVKEIKLTSGTILVTEEGTAKKGDIIVAPYVIYDESTKLPVPAKAEIRLYVELISSVSVKVDLENSELQKVIEENKKRLYNELSCFEQGSDFIENVQRVETEGIAVITVTLSGEITIR